MAHATFHDGQVEGWSLLPNKSLRIDIADVTGGKFSMFLQNVRSFKGNNFREGNIILDVEIVRNADPGIDRLRSLFDLEPTASPAFLLIGMRQVQEGELTFVAINPSYGCEISALCENVTIEERAGRRGIARSDQ